MLWILGGDRPPRVKGSDSEWVAKTAKAAGFGPDQDWTPIWRAIASGIKEGGGSTPTIVYHPQGGVESTSITLHDESWLSINGMQSGHGGGHDVPVWEMIARDFAMTPPKPTLDLEPNYEDHPYNPWPQWDPATGYFRDHDVRKAGLSLGLCGRMRSHLWTSFGLAIRQSSAMRSIIMQTAIGSMRMYRPAARQMGFLRLLMESRPYFSAHSRSGTRCREPRRGRIAYPGNARPFKGTYAFLYFPINDQKATGSWARLEGKANFARGGSTREPELARPSSKLSRRPGEFRSPPYGPDWVLVLEDANAEVMHLRV